MINELSKQIHAINVKNGFFETKKNIGEMLALIHSEISEALEADRKGKHSDWGFDTPPIIQPQDLSDEKFKSLFESEIKDSFEDELADACIRIFDLAAFKEIDIEYHIKQKMRYNSLRPYKHGKKY